jgi:1-acyl-sn-glycerol-3-phosphate acyltransferase
VSLLRSFLITDPLIVMATLVYWAASQAASLFDDTGRKQARIASAWGRALLRIGRVKVKVEGLEKISTEGSYVFVSNHLSYMDTPVVLANIPVQFRFLAKRGLFQIPFLGWHLKRAGHIPVPRGDARAAVKTMTLAAQIVRERGISLLVFPEGGRSRDGSLGTFKEGAAYIAIQAGVPLVPIGIKGTREVLPFGSGHVKKGIVTMRIGDPIPTGQASPRDRVRLTGELRHQILALREEQPIHV